MKNWIDHTVSTAALEQFSQTLAQTGTQLHAMELYEKGQCLVQWAVQPYSCTHKREVYSLSKSFTSTAIGLAFDRGLLHPDDLLSKYFPQQIAAQTDPRWQTVKVRHLLSMTTGHSGCAMMQMALAPDSLQGFFSTPLEHEPGEFFAYSTGASCVLAEIVLRATGQTVPDFLASQLFCHMDMENILWDCCLDGRCQGGTGLKISCHDIAKLGLLYCQKGMWNGKQLLSPEWVELASTKQASNEGNGTSDWCAGYGFQFWVNSDMGFRGDGAFGQLCVILPEQELVIAVVAESLNMAEELNALWKLVAQLHSPKAGAGLPSAYPLTPSLLQPDWDSGWLNCTENPMELTKMRLVAQKNTLKLTLCDGQRSQTLCADTHQWTENTLFLKEFRPMLYRQMPHNQVTPQTLAVHCYYDNHWVIDCRMLNTPHRFLWHFIPHGEQLEVKIESPLDVFGGAKAWTALRPH